MEPQAPPAPETHSTSSTPNCNPIGVVSLPPALAAAIVAAQRAVGAVEKGSTNPFHRYKYASAEAMLAEARGALGTAGLAMVEIDRHVPDMEKWQAHQTEAEYKGEKTVKTARLAQLTVTYLVVHEGGEGLVIRSCTPAIAESGRPEDKAVATADTYSMSYAMRGLLLIPRVEEGTDVDQRDDAQYEPSPARPLATPHAAPPPQFERPPRQPRQPRQPREPRMAPAFDLAPPHALPSIAKPWPPETLKSVHDRMTTLAIDGKDLVAYLVSEHGARECGRISETLNTIPAARAPAIEEWMVATAQARAAVELGVAPAPGASKLTFLPAGPNVGDAQDQIPM